MTEQEADLLDRIMTDIFNESPTLKRLFEESVYQEGIGSECLTFSYQAYRLSLELKILPKVVTKKTEKLTGKEARKLFPKLKKTNL